MPQLLAYRVALRAAQFALAAAVILFLLLLVSRQAHAATGDQHPGTAPAATSALAGLTEPASAKSSAAGNPLSSATGAVGSVVNSAAQTVTGAGAPPAPAS